MDTAPRHGRLVLGFLTVLVGVVGMTASIAATYGQGAAYQRALFALGLPGSLLLSGAAQCAIYVGCWLLWSGWRTKGPMS